MKFEKYSYETVAELLAYLAENESFDSLRAVKNVTTDELRELLQDMASQLREKAKDTPIMRKSQLQKKDLAYKTHQVISKLTPQEEEILFKTFKIS